ncbi:Mitotic spindle checkpoint protein MAD1 [Rhynchospora pubera]|uniref:Mitotic spindle checkpoint protein MAD1 n=1 Tax=Rhynchospora pubera TaxID=906938 RepID=A0AAV8H7U6_9POAL|nr:Mitotic spindle checkpoint protein MAD1 [Rhynchospora pubera]
MQFLTPPSRKRRAEAEAEAGTSAGTSGAAASPVSDRRIVLYEQREAVPFQVPRASFGPSDQLMCTYHCRQMVKSEFFVALDTAEKENAEYKARLAALNEQLYKIEEEREKYRDEASFLQQELAASKARENSLQERFLKEVDNSEERYRDQLRCISELEFEIKKEMDSRAAAEQFTETLKETVRELQTKLESLSDSSDREINSLRRELSYVQDESKFSSSKVTAELERTTLRAESAEEEAELLNEQLIGLKEQLDECLTQKGEIEHNHSSSNISPSNASSDDDKKMIKLLQEELHNYEKEVQEARKLKSSQLNSELLKEKLLEEQSRRERAELELSKLHELQVKAQKLELELTSWKSLLNDIPDIGSYSDIPKKFAELQKEALENMAKLGEITAQLKEIKVAMEYADLSKQRAETECMLAKEKVESSSLEVKRLQLMLASVTEERDRLRKDSSASNKDAGPSDDSRVEELEAALNDKEQMMKEMESSLQEHREMIAHQHAELKLFNDRLADESKKVKSLERESDRLRHEVALLESKLGHGDYSSSNTKVLRMVHTLAVENEAKQTIEALQAELKRTTERLQAVEELKGQFDAALPEKLVQLKNQIAVLEKREERYKAVFAEKISVFRKACCSLFGYKIVMDDQKRPNGIPVTRFTLQSIYAQSDDEKLEFEYESGSMNIVMNDYTSQTDIAHQIEIFTRKMNSIPAFTANLTVECFNRRTLC